MSKLDEFHEKVEPLYPCPPATLVPTNMRGLGASEMAQAIIEGRKSLLDPYVNLHIVEAFIGFETSARTGEVYNMTTTCGRPGQMNENWGLWQVK